MACPFHVTFFYLPGKIWLGEVDPRPEGFGWFDYLGPFDPQLIRGNMARGTVLCHTFNFQGNPVFFDIKGKQRV